MPKICYCNDCCTARDTPISTGKGTVPYGSLLVRGTTIRIGDNTYVYDNELYLPNDLNGWWLDKTRRMIGAHYFLENYLTGHTVEVLDHGSRRRPPLNYGLNE